MAIYVYDGTFEGLLTVMHETFVNKKVPTEIRKQGEFPGDLLEEVIVVNTDFDKSSRVYQGIIDKHSIQILQRIYYLYLSEDKMGSLFTYNYLKKIAMYGKVYDENLNDELINKVQSIYQKVARERHRMLGLLRFQELKEGTFYASMEPDYDILALVAPHFAKRMAELTWCIHDKKRSKAAIYHNHQWSVMEDCNFEQQISYASEEAKYQDLWQLFFQHISIADKRNTKLQKQKMPKKYWKHLTEISNESW